MISAQNIRYAIDGKVLLDDVSTCMASGKVTAILGPNGAGKSTLLRCLTGALRPQQGVVILAGEELNSYSLSELSKKRAVLSQSASINFPFTAEEIVLMGRNPYGGAAHDLDIVHEALHNVDALHLKDRVFPTLSGGEQQRIQLARVLAQLWNQKDAYLFLDEPTSALDLKHQHLILELVKKYSMQGMSVVTILHDIHLVHAYADDVILLKEGMLVAQGTTEEVLTHDNIADVFEVSREIIPMYRVNVSLQEK